MSETRTCLICKRAQPIRSYYKYKDGRSWSTCIRCICAARKADYESRKEHFAVKSARQNKHRDDRRRDAGKGASYE